MPPKPEDWLPGKFPSEPPLPRWMLRKNESKKEANFFTAALLGANDPPRWLPEEKRKEMTKKYGYVATEWAEAMTPEEKGPKAAQEAAKYFAKEIAGEIYA